MRHIGLISVQDREFLDLHNLRSIMAAKFPHPSSKDKASKRTMFRWRHFDMTLTSKNRSCKTAASRAAL